MDSDDGTQAFGELGQSEPTAVHWDTPEWREEMERRYAHVHECVDRDVARIMCGMDAAESGALCHAEIAAFANQGVND